MAIEAVHLLDHVFPRVPIRQWVLSLPFELRFLLATDRSILSAILRIFVDVVFARYRSRTHGDDAQCGAVAFIQRFDSALNLNVHFHVLLLDGAYAPSDDDLIFSNVRAPTEQELVALSTAIARRVMRLLVRRGIIDKDGSPQVEIEGVDPGRSRFGWLTSERRAVFATPDPSLGDAGSSAEVLGFSIHAGVSVNAHDRAGLERLVRYVARPPIASGQLQETTDGRIALKFSKARPNGATHVFFSPLQLIRRLTSLIPPSGQNLIRYFGILAPAARLRAKVVPCPKIEIRIAPDPGAPRELPRRSNIDWASLLKRVFDIDALLCPCGGRIRIRAVIVDPAVIRRILTHLRLDTEPPRFAPPRAPP